MKSFIHEDFLLTNRVAKKLYHGHAEKMPIFDYHCHLSPKAIAENKQYRNLTELWLGEDHYKWRVLRASGVEEKYITGTASDREKFQKWAETMPKCIGNPLYHWTHLELKRYFGVDELLTAETAEEIWHHCNRLLQREDFRARGLIERSNVTALCTTDDPTDSLEYHRVLAKDSGFKVKVLPAFRPDKGYYIERPGFVRWVAKLAAVTGRAIEGFNDLKAALKERIDFFHDMGCCVSDHGLEPLVYQEGTEAEADAAFRKALRGEALSPEEIGKYKTKLLLFLGRACAGKGWVMQLHLNPRRNSSTRMYKLIGPDTGFDAMGDYLLGEALTQFLDQLDQTDELPKTILYSLNPRDNELLATIAGCFQGGGIPGKMQLGAAWWFNDHLNGIIRQLVALASTGLLSQFVGMLTDSRSFLSFVRHEYFRRILCNLLGEWVVRGEAPADFNLLGKMVEDICYHNACRYFGLAL
ncbi:MAG TPA: glucuronate isomerase [Capillibacterium sp.]